MKHRRQSSFSFNTAPAVHMSRTLFPLRYDVKTSLNVGELTPIGAPLEVYPGDTFKIDGDFVSRLSSAFVRPVMDTMVAEFSIFFVPCRILYDKFGEVVSGGPAGPNAWVTTYSQSVPHLNANDGESYTVPAGTVMDYLGIAPGEEIKQETSILPVRGFAKIWDDWFRNENFIVPLNLQTGERSSWERPNNNVWSVNNYFGKLPRVGKRKDYFTSALPSTQKGSVVDILNVAGGFTPLTTAGTMSSFGGIPMLFQSSASYPGPYSMPLFGYNVNGDSDLQLGYNTSNASSGNVSSLQSIDGSNLGVNIPEANINVNDLRYSVAVQRVLERLALCGNRLTEVISALFGVTSPDARQQRSEFLGGASIPLAQQAVDQTSRTEKNEQGDIDEYLGTQAAYSLSNGSFHASKAFTEHGYIYILGVVRQNTHNYQQGVPALYNRTSRFDFYVPQFAFLSQQPIYKSELYAGAEPDSVFGYKEAWAELRYIPNQVTGAMRSNVPNSYDVMHFADKFANEPVLNKQFIEETSANLDRTIQVPTAKAPNYLLDVFISGSMVRVLPSRSVPGLVDHI